MFGKLFKRSEKEKSEKPIACAVGDGAVDEGSTPGRRGRKMSDVARRAHVSVAAVLTAEPMTRAQVLAVLTDENERAYVHANWQNVIARLVAEGKAKLADGGASRGRSVAYQRAA